jgi:hypothetical protein
MQFQGPTIFNPPLQLAFQFFFVSSRHTMVYTTNDINQQRAKQTHSQLSFFWELNNGDLRKVQGGSNHALDTMITKEEYKRENNRRLEFYYNHITL